MSRIQQYLRKYGHFAGVVLSSIARVARAGRTEDPERIEAAHEEHAAIMKKVNS
jgi:hypothetical protein